MALPKIGLPLNVTHGGLSFLSTHQTFFSVSVAIFRKTHRASFCKLLKEWFKNPMNIALFIWILCVFISVNIMFMLTTGMFNGVLPEQSQRDNWLEASIHIINALFTLMSLYHQPKLLYDLVLLLRWRPEDVLKLRKSYCKNGTSKPNEWAHMMVLVALLHLKCFAQYILFGITAGLTQQKRPAIALGLLISVAASTAVFSHAYSLLSPLGREYETDNIQKAETGLQKSLERTNSSNPQWIGGLFHHVKSDALVVCKSVLCSFCVFGWNMERLGFGNMYVHIVTFFLFCFAPFIIFNLGAMRIDNEAVREALGIVGVLLCVSGLMYGGYWRSQMRKRFNLPEYNFCCGNASAADCLQWLCCCPCALAQEVKTANHYDVKEGKFFLKKGRDGENVGVSPFQGVPPLAEGDEFLKITVEMLKPPVSPVVSREVGSTP
ncbi:hypothetical protein KSP39_PZI013857 [Platanthera zijinensis]|uniref:PLAC8 motif-containing protein n=1 Tax=Platanthera zijinensis TaxID=2320716 RepID=A0AAP0G334_9ASPA